MILTVKWSALQKRWIQKTESKDYIVRAYFEDNERLFLFLGLEGIMFCAEVPKKEINLVNFKLEFLSAEVLELTQNPLDESKKSIELKGFLG